MSQDLGVREDEVLPFRWHGMRNTNRGGAGRWTTCGSSSVFRGAASRGWGLGARHRVLDDARMARFTVLICLLATLGVPGYAALGSGCALHVDVAGPLVALAVPTPVGSVVLGLLVPNNAALAGGVLNAQVVVGLTANPPFLLDVSNAIGLRLGR